MDPLGIIDRLAGWWLTFRIDQAVKHDPALEEFRLHSINVLEKGWEATMISPAIACLADEAATMLNRQRAENYVQFDMMPRVDRGLRPIRVTVQWAGRKSPAEKNAELTQENKALKGQLEWLAKTARAVLNHIYEFQEIPSGEILDGLERQLTELGYWPVPDGEDAVREVPVIPRLDKLARTARKIVKSIWGRNQMPDQETMQELWDQLHELKSMGYLAGSADEPDTQSEVKS
jgi:hypothetical protein